MKLIVAVDEKWGIGKKNDLLFSIPEDMKHFREVTSGKTVVMGLNTLRSFPGGRPLKNRINIVLSDEDIPAQEGLVICRSLDELKKELKKYPPDELFIIGGGMMYRQFCDYCSEAEITKVEADGEATVFFPNLDQKENWECAAIGEPIVTNGYTVRFCTYKNQAVTPL